MGKSSLPAQFNELERFVDQWALPLESQRNVKRISSEMWALQEFYDIMLPRLEEAVEFLNQFPLSDMPDDAERLLWMTFSMMEIALPVEVLGQPNMPDSVDDRRFEFPSEARV